MQIYFIILLYKLSQKYVDNTPPQILGIEIMEQEARTLFQNIRIYDTIV